MLIVLMLCTDGFAQWNGSAAVSVIEAGAGRWHVAVELSEIDPALYPIEPSRDVIDRKALGQFAIDAEETRFVDENDVSILSAPVFYVSPLAGYHSSNALIGM